MAGYTEYLGYREAALKINSKIPEDYPCRCCQTPDCCARGVRLTIFDAQYIIGGFKKGELPRKIVGMAIKEAQDNNNGFCSFLNRNTNKCLIYTHRPLQCMLFSVCSLVMVLKLINRV